MADKSDRVKYLIAKENECLKEKLDAASKIMKNCHFCERRCGANRKEGERGWCGVLEPKISSEFLHFGEESELIPSHTIFFTGCTFACRYCQNRDISQYPKRGIYIEPEILVKLIVKRKQEGARNVNWVGGDPTPDIPYILDVLNRCNVNTPQVWNSNMYLTEESLNILEGVMDIYLTDFKYGNDSCAERLSGVGNYREIITRNHKIISDRNNKIIIRHLVLPEHLECCTFPVLRWISKNLNPENVKVNVMGQYHPEWKARDYGEINRRLTMDELERAMRFADGLGLDLC